MVDNGYLVVNDGNQLAHRLRIYLKPKITVPKGSGGDFRLLVFQVVN